MNERNFGSIREKIRPFGHILDYVSLCLCLLAKMIRSPQIVPFRVGVVQVQFVVVQIFLVA